MKMVEIYDCVDAWLSYWQMHACVSGSDLEVYRRMIERGFDLDFGTCTILSLEEFKSQKGNDCGWLEFLDGRSDVYRCLVFGDSLAVCRGLSKGSTAQLVFHVRPARNGGFDVILSGVGRG